jgi:hypothetical protein
MPTCSAGHDSASTDFCDVCGMRLGVPVPGVPGPGVPGPGVPGPGVPGPGVPGPGPGQPGQTGSASGVAGAMPLQPGFDPGQQGPAATPGELCPQCGAGRTGQFCEACGYSFAAGAVRVTTAPSYIPAPPAPASAAAGPIPAAPGTTPPGRAGAPPAAPGHAGAAPAPTGPSTGAPAGTGGASVRPDSAFAGHDPGSAAGTAAWTAVVTADRAYFDSVIAASGPEAAGLEFPAYCPERRFRLQGTEIRIGRRSVSRGLEPEIDLTGPPADPGVSHLHAVLIAESDGGWTVFDPGSSNGTQVNGREIPPGSRVRLHNGDRVCVGAWTVLTLQAT